MQLRINLVHPLRGIDGNIELIEAVDFLPGCGSLSETAGRGATSFRRVVSAFYDISSEALAC
jgi:hypothetical protein